MTFEYRFTPDIPSPCADHSAAWEPGLERAGLNDAYGFGNELLEFAMAGAVACRPTWGDA